MLQQFNEIKTFLSNLWFNFQNHKNKKSLQAFISIAKKPITQLFQLFFILVMTTIRIIQNLQSQINQIVSILQDIYMQQAFQAVRIQVLAKLKPSFDKYANSDGQLNNSRLQELIREVFSLATSQDIFYVVRNIHRLDVDHNGKVSFEQFSNFIIRMHIGEMSLQKRHLNGWMKNGDQRKMSEEQFKILINEAVSFLNMTIPDNNIKHAFSAADQDKDGFITYVEYFQVVQQEICSPRKPPAHSKIKINSGLKEGRLRLFIWNQVRRLYYSFTFGRDISISQMTEVVDFMISGLTQLQYIFLMAGLLKLKGPNIQFMEFASTFIYLIGQIGLSRFRHYRKFDQTGLSVGQFVVLFSNTYKFLDVVLINVEFLELAYNSIKEAHKEVNYTNYLTWVKQYLSVAYWYGKPYYFKQDDLSNSNYQKLFYLKVVPHLVHRKVRYLIPFKFSSHTLAYLVRQRMYHILVQFDKNKDQLFSVDEIRQALIVLLQQNQFELEYVTRNVFRYDVDGDKNVTYDELTNFMVQWHFGQMSIQRLHKNQYYSRGPQKCMNFYEFSNTLNLTLSALQLEANEQQLKTLFRQIDLNHNGWISYEVYFSFMRFYFGSMSVAYQQPRIEAKKAVSFKQHLQKMLLGLNCFDRFVKLILEQLRLLFLIYDENNNQTFEPYQIQAILSKVFHLNQYQTRMIMFEIFRMDSRYANSIAFEQLVSIILDIYFIHLLLLKKIDKIGRRGWKDRKINQKQFINLIMDGCFFITIKPYLEDLKSIFEALDTDKDGFITLSQYIDFIRKYLGKQIVVNDEPPQLKSPLKKLPTVSDKQFEFVSAIWDQLRILFNSYDKNGKGWLTQQEFKFFAIQILNEKTTNQLRYIFWNLFRLDCNLDQKIQFEQFAPYVLRHAGQIALQRFHAQQVRGKNNLSEEQLFILISNAYKFLTTMPKSRENVSSIYKRIKKNDTLTYGGYLSWIHEAMMKKYE